jgi:dTDP-4-amino-4,6-dideoxygalactose transaminase
VKPFRIWLSPPHLCGKEQEYVNEAFASNWIAPLGPHVDAFEKELSEYVGVKHAAALSSGTAAIHLALLTLGIKPGDHVICSSFTFAGSCNPIAYCGAKPVFVDSEESTWNMCPELLEEALTSLEKEGTPAKAIILVELYGVPAQMELILDICKKHRVPLIEDSAEALGSSFKGKKLGAFGTIGILSFNGNKIITTSGGGALLSDDENLVKKSRFLATQARDPAPHYEHSHIGYNYRMSNLIAAVGRGLYEKRFASSGDITFQPCIHGSMCNRWLTTVLTPSSKARDRIIAALAESAIESRPLWKPMHLQPVFRHARSFSNGQSEALFSRGLCLPSGSALSEQEVQEIAEIVLSNL